MPNWTPPPVPRARGATIEIDQLSNGYWRGEVTLTIPCLPGSRVESCDLFHDAGEALNWARMTIENMVMIG